MNDINKFQELIRETIEIAKNHNNTINSQQVKDIFKDMELNDVQWDQIVDYLAVNKINVLDYVKTPKTFKSREEHNIENTETSEINHKSTNEDTAQDSIYLKQYLEELKFIRPGSKEEEIELLPKIVTGDKAAKERFIELQLQRVVEIASEYKNQGMKVEDLIQEGNMALIQSLAELPDNKDINVIQQFIYDFVRHGIEEALEEQKVNEKIDNELMEKSNQIYAALKELEEDLGRKANIHELAGYINMTEEEIYEILELTANAMNLNDDHSDHHHNHGN